MEAPRLGELRLRRHRPAPPREVLAQTEVRVGAGAASSGKVT